MIQFDFNNVYAGETKKLWSLLIQIPVLLKKNTKQKPYTMYTLHVKEFKKVYDYD